jgi:hypothetical protein
MPLVSVAAGPTYRREESEIPLLPKAPAPIPGGSPSDTFRCTRFFTWKGKTHECDSFVRQDAEKLRSIVGDVPAAVNELNEYQATRARVQNAAYVGTAGLLLAVIGIILNGRYNDEAPAGQNISKGIAILGLGAAGGSFMYALGTIQTNEARLGSAIQHYNSARPETPVELQFSTGFAF